MELRSRRQLWVITGILWLITGSVMVCLFTYDRTQYQKTTIMRVTEDGITHAIDIYEPKDLDDGPTPVVILVHGIAVSKEFFANFAIEFTKLGFIAVCPEMRGHGISSGAVEDAKIVWEGGFYLNMPDVRRLQAEMNSTYAYLS